MDYFELIVAAIIVIYSLFSSLSKNKKKRPTKQPDRSPVPDASGRDETLAESQTEGDTGFEADYSDRVFPHNFGDQVDNSAKDDPHFRHMEEHDESQNQPESDPFYESSENRPGAYAENLNTLSNTDSYENDKSDEFNKSLENVAGDQITQDIHSPIEVKKVSSKKNKAKTINHLLKDKNTLQEGIMLKEILDSPVSKRKRLR